MTGTKKVQISGTKGIFPPYVDLPVICTFKFCVGIVARQVILLSVL